MIFQTISPAPVRFAMMEEKAVISLVLRNFSLTSKLQTVDIPLLAELVLRTKHGLHCTFDKRNRYSWLDCFELIFPKLSNITSGQDGKKLTKCHFLKKSIQLVGADKSKNWHAFKSYYLNSVWKFTPQKILTKKLPKNGPKWPPKKGIKQIIYIHRIVSIVLQISPQRKLQSL